MSLKARLFLYIAFLHLPFAAIAIVAFQKEKLLLLAVEALFVLTFALGVLQLRAVFGPLDILLSGVELLKERDFATRFRETGSPDLDRLVTLYNELAGSLRDERIRAEEQHHFLEKVLAASPSGILTLDYDGRTASMNPSAGKLLRRRDADVLGKRPEELGPPFGEALAALRAGESRVLSVFGGRRVRVQRGEFLDRGFPRPFFVLEELTEELRQSEKAAYEKLIRVMSHEVNNSVGAVRSLLTSCLAYRDQLAPADREDFEGALAVAISRTGELAEFVHRFAEVVKIPAPRKEPVDVERLLRSVAALFDGEAKRRRVAFRWEVTASPRIALDRGLMEQALVNVVKNALEAIGENGTVTVRLSSEGVEIEDSGPGIQGDVRERLFTPFFSTKENGQGIGLTVVHEILGSHGFAFGLEGPEGGPTRFRVTWS